jgi:hypothetical protein
MQSRKGGNATARLIGASKSTALKLLADVGDARALYPHGAKSKKTELIGRHPSNRVGRPQSGGKP